VVCGKSTDISDEHTASNFRVQKDKKDTGVKVGGMPRQLATCFHVGILLGLFNHEDGGNVPLKNHLTFYRPHGVIT
jgi:hypothetical protein